MGKVKDFFSAEEQQTIVNAIAAAEKGTVAEIRVHLDSVCLGNPISSALKLFHKLGMDKTAEHNGVLIYVAYKSRKCAIIGDSGINAVVGDGFWDECYKLMTDNFREGDFVSGISLAIERAGDKLKEFFPYKDGDINELPDEISFGK